MKVLIADKFEKVGIDALEDIGCEVTVSSDLGPETMPAAMREINPDVLVVRSTKVKADALEAAERLSLIVRAGAGYDNIDVAAASARGVFVANCPGKNSQAVAELTWGLILACDRRIPDQTQELREGKWNKKEYSKARGLYGRTLGIIGLGTIGREVAVRGQAFGMKVVAWSRSLTPDAAAALGIQYCESPIEVARIADVVTLHVAGAAETKQLVDKAFIEAMKPGAYLINTARGTVVDQNALLWGLREKGLRAGLDVFADEPEAGDKTFSDSIVKEAGVYGTHHVGASTDQAQVAVAHETVRIIQSYMECGEVPNAINRLARSSATHILSVRHRNRPGVLAHVFAQLAGAGINVEEVENIIYHGAEATCARIHLDGVPGESVLEKIRTGNADVISVQLAAIE